ncbi:unnamed protein product [Oppiella nova]|uniref:Uncharacterized protein n=1 Tax=Oppiella nova TaxID=334625 RepID=A0A7R9MBD8_9ACAR|nr:unnamed protein product [Oppiella nova]CAG2172978.1 unnamed protein product [Oppiella nova]
MTDIIPIITETGMETRERVAYYTRSCEDTFTERQRDARNSSALHYYRDCLRRVVEDRCRDTNPLIIDTLMGSRKRDLDYCPAYTRDDITPDIISGQQYNQYDNHRYNDRDRYDRYGQRDYSGILNITTGIMIGTDGYRDSGNNLHDDPCIQKALYYVKNCENTLVDDQRDARTGSHHNDCIVFILRLRKSGGEGRVHKPIVGNSGHTYGVPETGFKSGM